MKLNLYGCQFYVILFVTYLVDLLFLNLNVKIIATHAGILTGEDGVSAQSIEDIAIMSALHNFKVIVPCDVIEALQATRIAIESEGPFYIRLSRPATPVINKKDYKFVLAHQMKVISLRNLDYD